MTQADHQFRAQPRADPDQPAARGGRKTRQSAVASVNAKRPREHDGKCEAGWTQRLTLMLEGITAGDYLTWIRDPEPLVLGMSLRSVAVSAAPIGDRIEVELCWNDPPPPIRSAAIAAGFSLTPEVTLHGAGQAQSPEGTP